MSKDVKKKLVPKLRFPEFQEAEEWEPKPLGKLGEIITGNTPSTSDKLNYGGDKMFVSPADISGHRFVSQTKTTLSEKGFANTRQILPQSILFVCIGSTIGKVAQNMVECATNQQINSVIPFNNYVNAFVYYSLDLNAPAIAELAGKQAVPIINKSLFSTVVLNVPGKKEQQKIADCLSSVDDLITAQAQKLDALKAHKKGLMQQLFPAEGETVPKLRFPEFQDAGEWEVVPMGSLLKRNPEYGVNAPAVPYSRDLPTYLRITDIDDDGRYLSESKVSVDIVATEGNYLGPGDIVLARTGASVGKSYRYREEDGRLVFAGFLIRIRPEPKKVNSTFLSNFLTTQQYWTWVGVTSARSGQPGINGTEYSSLPVPVPTTKAEDNGLSEQQKIADCLSSIDDLIAAQIQKLDALKVHKKGLMQQLFPTIDEMAG